MHIDVKGNLDQTSRKKWKPQKRNSLREEGQGMEVFVVIEHRLYALWKGGDTKERHLLATRSTYQMAWSSGTFLPFLAFTMARCELLPRHNRKTVARIFLYHVPKGCKHLCQCCDATEICQNSGFRLMINVMINIFVEQKKAKPVQHIQIIPSFSHHHLDTINMKTANFHLFHKPTSHTQTGQLWRCNLVASYWSNVHRMHRTNPWPAIIGTEAPQQPKLVRMHKGWNSWIHWSCVLYSWMRKNWRECDVQCFLWSDWIIDHWRGSVFTWPKWLGERTGLCRVPPDSLPCFHYPFIDLVKFKSRCCAGMISFFPSIIALPQQALVWTSKKKHT